MCEAWFYVPGIKGEHHEVLCPGKLAIWLVKLEKYNIHNKKVNSLAC